MEDKEKDTQNADMIVNKGQQPIVPTDMTNLITITVAILVKGRVFKVNEQYRYEEKVIIPIGCGCGGKPKVNTVHYRILMGSVFFDIPQGFAVETQQIIPPEGQDFNARRVNLGDTQDVKDFNPYRANNDPNAIAALANNVPM
jgi:hypothetical protein